MSRGLGKGLDSLIPEFYDEDFDSNSAQSLEDMLNDDADESGEKEPEVEKQVEVDDDGEGNPEKDNVIARHKHIRRIEIIIFRGLLRPAKG